MKYSLEAYSIHELGQRPNQEDSLFPEVPTIKDRLFILCDGMGGHAKGEVASSTVCKAISDSIRSHWNPNEPLSDQLLQQAISAAYDALDAKDGSEERKMGTTLALLCLHADGATVAHIGDSRVYQFRPGQGVVFRTQDHSLVNDLVKIGEITEEEAMHHPQKNVITRAMQPHQPQRAKADIAHLSNIKSGDYFYLCSDGMLEQTSDDNLVNIITKSGFSNQEKKNQLLHLTKDNSDNHTAHLIYISKVEEVPQVCREPLVYPQAPSKSKRIPYVPAIVAAAIVLSFVCGFVSGLYYEKAHSVRKNSIQSTSTNPNKVKDKIDNDTLFQKKDSTDRVNAEKKNDSSRVDRKSSEGQWDRVNSQQTNEGTHQSQEPQANAQGKPSSDSHHLIKKIVDKISN